MSNRTRLRRRDGKCRSIRLWTRRELAWFRPGYGMGNGPAAVIHNGGKP